MFWCRFADLLLACALFFLIGGTAQALNDNPRTNPQTPPALQTQKDTLIVGSEQDFPPFATGLTSENAGGFTVELWRAVAA